jgi:mannose-1-phosphate guanylyltransferase
MTVKGIIMAGGEGKRFRPLTKKNKKCMIPIGTKQKPILEYSIRLFRHNNIKDITVLSGYKSQQIESYFSNGHRFGVKIQYILDKPNFKGSASALLNAYEEGVFKDSDTLIVYYGDILSNINLSKFVRHHLDSRAYATVALANNFNLSVGTADMDGMWIKKFKEKPTIDTPVSIGILAFNGAILENMKKQYEENQYEEFDLMGDVIQNLVNKGEKVSGYLTNAFWYDVGSIERYERLSNTQVDEALDFLF